LLDSRYREIWFLFDLVKEGMNGLVVCELKVFVVGVWDYCLIVVLLRGLREKGGWIVFGW
ncbi:hypothetical protein, partial [Bacillus subtilis]|uniref:hypothetical protein n=1 Tax=Bacillus subtilis TaxID=1423 RepID=UPI001BDB9833